MSDRAPSGAAAITTLRVPDARDLSEMNASLRDAIAATTGRALLVYVAAAVHTLQAESDRLEEERMFDPDDPDDAWQTFDNLIAEAPVKATHPVTVATDVKVGLTAVFVALADLVNAHGKLAPGDAVAQLAAMPYREAHLVRVMAATTARGAHLLREDPLCRVLDYPRVFRTKLEALLRSKSLADPGAEQLAGLYLNFVKVVAWHAAAGAYESGHLTLNRAAFFHIFAGFAVAAGPADGPVVRDALHLVRLTCDHWTAATLRLKTAKKAAADAAAARAAAAAKAKAGAAAKPPAAKPGAGAAAKPATGAAAKPAAVVSKKSEAAGPTLEIAYEEEGDPIVGAPADAPADGGDGAALGEAGLTA